MYLIKNMKKLILIFILAFNLTSAFAVTKSDAEANPKDAELNRTYAIEMLAKGDYAEALAGIERTIIAKPTDIPARFFRAKVLVILGRGEEVKDELEFITTLKLAPSDIDEAKKLLDEIEFASRTFSGSISIQYGFGYTDNANSWSKTGMRTDTVPLKSLYSEDKKDDTTYNGAAIFSGKNILNDDRTLSLKFTLGKTLNEAMDSYEKDMKVTLGSVGLDYESKNGLLLGLKTGYTEIDRNNEAVNSSGETESLYTDITSRKHSLEIGKKYDSGAKVSLIYSETDDDHKLGTSPNNSDANITGVELKTFYPLTDSSVLSASIYRKESRADLTTDAAKRSSNKDTTGISMKLLQVLAKGHLMTYGYSRSETDFLNQDIPSTSTKRADESSVYSLSYRIDGDKLWDPIKDWKVTFGFKHSDSDSNLKASQVESNSASVLISRVFTF